MPPIVIAMPEAKDTCHSSQVNPGVMKMVWLEKGEPNESLKCRTKWRA